MVGDLLRVLNCTTIPQIGGNADSSESATTSQVVYPSRLKFGSSRSGACWRPKLTGSAGGNRLQTGQRGCATSENRLQAGYCLLSPWISTPNGALASKRCAPFAQRKYCTQFPPNFSCRARHGATAHEKRGRLGPRLPIREIVRFVVPVTFELATELDPRTLTYHGLWTLLDNEKQTRRTNCVLE